MKTAEQWMKEWSATPNTVLISTACWIEAIQADAKEEARRELEALKKDKERLAKELNIALKASSSLIKENKKLQEQLNLLRHAIDSL